MDIKKILIILFASMCCLAQAEESCPATDAKVVVVFGNGILTSQASAIVSLLELKQAIGPNYNNQKIAYDLAYNFTDGPLLDLLQSVTQVVTQFDSQIMAWLNNLNAAPDWFNSMMQRIYISIDKINAPELSDHVAKYQQALDQGQKILLVSHSQGNFYANEAKKILQLQAMPSQIEGFSIFAVATPANNVGGAAVPYLTNHRDIILLVPGALAQNLVLQRVDGTGVDTISRMQAHSFADTYMSEKFNARTTIMTGIFAQLDKLKMPTTSCANYRIAFVGLLAGSYPASCGGVLASPSISATGIVSMPDGTIDLSDASVYLNIGRQEPDPSKSFVHPGVSLYGGSTIPLVGGGWSLTGAIDQLQSAYVSCDKSPKQPTSSFSAPIDIGAKAMSLIKGHREIFPVNTCAVGDTGTLGNFTAKMAVSVDGNKLSIGDYNIDLGAERFSELVNIMSATYYQQNNFEPRFSYSADYADGTHLNFTYRYTRGFKDLAYTNKDKTLICWRNDQY